MDSILSNVTDGSWRLFLPYLDYNGQAVQRIPDLTTSSFFIATLRRMEVGATEIIARSSACCRSCLSIGLRDLVTRSTDVNCPDPKCCDRVVASRLRSDSRSSCILEALARKPNWLIESHMYLMKYCRTSKYCVLGVSLDTVIRRRAFGYWTLTARTWDSPPARSSNQVRCCHAEASSLIRRVPHHVIARVVGLPMLDETVSIALIYVRKVLRPLWSLICGSRQMS